MNGVNLDLFQFEYDLTWMAFFMDSNDHFYARYGGRDDADPQSYLTKESLVRVMRAALELHRAGRVRTARYEPTGKEFRTPEEMPTMAAMMAKREVKCIHCHDVKVAQLRDLQERDEFSRDLIFTYPTPATVGMNIAPDEQNRVQSVSSDSPAAAAGVRPGDLLVSADRERVISLADFARVLELTPKEATLSLDLMRAGQEVHTSLRLSGSWKKTPDPSWRASVGLAGPNAGFWAVELNDQQKRAEGLLPDSLALRVTFLFPNHPSAHSGLKLKDVVVEFDGKHQPMNTRQLHAYCQMNHNYGDKVPFIVKRDGSDIKLELELPDRPPKPGD